LATGRVERRLAAILAADVAGYSRLMGADEEGTLAALKAIRRDLADPKIKEHRGRIVKTTGDGLLIEFASVVDAVRCAVEIQQEMLKRNAQVPEARRIEFRMGINLGDIIRDGRDIYGDGVNITARLEALAEPGAVFVSNTVYEHVRDRLSFTFEDLGEQQVKNIARSVHVFRVRTETTVPTPAPVVALTLPDKPSVAILPFTNMSADPEQEFFAHGIAEDVITALSRYPSLFVIARNSSFSYKGRAVDVKTVGHELGVRYVLEGSLRKSGNRIRVTAQLVEAEAGKHVWAERYDRDVSDIFAVQDEITEAVTVAIAPAIANAEQRRALRQQHGSFDAWAAYQHGLWHVRRANQADNALAQKFFQQAIDLDPTFPGGYKGLSNAVIHAAVDFHLHDFPAMQASAEDLARQAVALDSTDAEALARLSNALLMRGDYPNALAAAQRAVVASPNLAGAYSNLAIVLIYSGRHRDGLTALDTCFRLNPRVPDSASHLNHRAAALYFCREYDAALETIKNVMHFYPDYPHPYRWCAASLGQLGRIDEARPALEQAVTIAPAVFDLYVRQRAPWLRPEDHAHMLDGLRKAGWSD
jgi:adenylate cyclase